MRGWLLPLVAALVGAAPATAAYRAVDLGPGWGNDVNSAGVVVGQSHDRAFVWTETGGMVDVGTLGGVRSSADRVTQTGQVVGWSYVDTLHWHTFSWTPAGGMVDVGVLDNAVGQSQPWDVNDAGQIVGQSNWAGYPPPIHAFSWTAGDGLVDLGVVREVNTVAYGVNESGRVVGASGKPFLWSATTGLQLVAQFSGGARDINDHGRIVGWAATPPGEHALIWPETGGMIDLGRTHSTVMAVNDADEVVWLTISDDGATTRVMFVGPAGQPIDIGTLGGANTGISTNPFNDAGQVVGWSEVASGARHAFVWSLADGMVDLGPGQASAISENGLVTGMQVAADGTWHAALWEPRSDTTPPTLTVHDVSADATEPTGATVDYTVTATDDTDPSPTVVCTPPPGSLFAIGDTTVTCTATDASQNSATATFVVHVRGAEEQAAKLADVLQTLPHGLATSLAAKLNGPTVQRLEAFVHEVDAQTGKALTENEAATLRTAAQRIEVVLGG